MVTSDELVIGQAFRAKYLDQALEYIAGHDSVRLATSDEIADHYARDQPRGANEHATPARTRGHK